MLKIISGNNIGSVLQALNTPTAEQIRSEGANEINSLIQHHFGINLVTCGNCGAILSHSMEGTITELTCRHCHYTGDLCDMPDLFY